MEDNIVYGVQVFEDYQSGGVVEVFSTFELARKYADKLEISCTESIDIIKLKIDEPDFVDYGENKEEFYYRHGK